MKESPLALRNSYMAGINDTSDSRNQSSAGSPSLLSPGIAAVLAHNGGSYFGDSGSGDFGTSKQQGRSRASSINSLACTSTSSTGNGPTKRSTKFSLNDDNDSDHLGGLLRGNVSGYDSVEIPCIAGYCDIAPIYPLHDNSVTMYRATDCSNGKSVLLKVSTQGSLEDLTRIRHEWSVVYPELFVLKSIAYKLSFKRGSNDYNQQTPEESPSSTSTTPSIYPVDSEHELQKQENSIDNIVGILRPEKCLRISSDPVRAALVYPNTTNLQTLRERYIFPAASNRESLTDRSSGLYTHGFGSGPDGTLSDQLGVFNFKSPVTPAKSNEHMIEVLNIVIAVLQTLSQVHRKSITHNGLTSSTIFIDENDNTFISGWDFSFSLTAEDTSRGFRKTHLKQIADYMGYVSPETTCLVNRLVDYRADFYSIGCILYELLLGILPFRSSDPAELAHLHVLRTPVAPSKLASWVPEALSRIIMKLLEKSADDRYATCKDVIYDLSVVLKTLEYGEAFDDDFVPGQSAGICPIFTPPQLIHGRDKELATLQSTYKNFETKVFQFTIVIGEPGSGKSRLIGELERTSIASNTFFSVTKYDEHLRGTPFYSIVSILKDIVHQILSGSMVYIAQWRENLISNLNVDLTVLYDQIPELEELVGKDYVNLIDRPAQPLGPVPREIRLKFVVKNLFCLLGTRGLTAVLDDIQWCPLREIALFRELATFSREQFDRDLHVTFVCAATDESCEQYHELVKLAKELDVVHREIRLGPLGFKAIRSMVQDALLAPNSRNSSSKKGSRYTNIQLSVPADNSDGTTNESSADSADSSAFALQVESLAKTIYDISKGNPLFASLILRHLFLEQYIYFDNVGENRFNGGRWKVDFEALVEIEPPTSIRETVLSMLQKLPRRTKDILRYAASICSSSFTLEDLAVGANVSFSDAATALHFALDAQLLLPTSIHYKFPFLDPVGTTNIQLYDDEIRSVAAASTYRFYHDLVQQAVYSLQCEDEAWKIHRLIGLRLIQDGDGSPHRILEIASQLQNAIPIVQSDEREIFLDYLVRAGKMVYAMSDFDMAYSFYDTALELLQENGKVVDNTNIVTDIYLSLVELLCNRKQYDECLAMIESVYGIFGSVYDKASLLKIKAMALYALNKSDEAISTGLIVMNMLGVAMEESENWNKGRAECLRPRIPVSIQGIRDLVKYKTSHDKRHHLIQDIISILTIPTILMQRFELFKNLAFTSVSMFVEHGATASCSISLLAVASLFQKDGGSGNLMLAYEYSKLAIVTLECDTEIGMDFGINIYEYYTLTLAIYFEPLSEVIRYYNVILCSGQTFEDHRGMLSLSYDLRPMCKFLAGERIPSVLEYFKRIKPVTFKHDDESGKLWVLLHQQGLINLCGSGNADPSTIEGQYFDVTSISKVMNSTSAELRYAYWVLRLMLSVIYGEKELAADIICNNLPDLIQSVMITVYHVMVAFYGSLAVFDKKKKSEADEHLLASFARDLEDWSRSCPSMFLHKYLLIKAELNKESNNSIATLDIYEDALNGALSEGFIHEAALICERCGEYMYQFSEKRALIYLKEASRLYGVWGSHLKVTLLSKKFPALMMTSFKLPKLSIAKDLATSVTNSNSNSNSGFVHHGKSWVGYEDDRTTIARQSSSPLKWILSNLFRDENEAYDEEDPLDRLSIVEEASSVEKSELTEDVPVAEEPSHAPALYGRKDGVDLNLNLKLALQSCVEISEAIDIESIAVKLLDGMIRTSGADYCVMLSLDDEGEIFVEAQAARNSVKVIPHEPIFVRPDLIPTNVVHQIIATGSTIRRTPDPQRFDSLFGRDHYFQGRQMNAVLCMPIQNQTKVVGALYMEKHNEGTYFSQANVEMGMLLCTQAAVSIEKARLYAQMDLAKKTAEEATAEKASFLANMSHEIRTPFNALLSCSIFLLDTELSDMQREYVETIRSSAMLTLNIIDAILAFSKIEHGSITLDNTPFSLRECVESAIQLVAEPAATKDLELVHLNRCGEIDTIYGDVTRVRQIIINLVGNAVKFTSKGHIVVETNVEQVSSDHRYEFVISVTDTGIGIPKIAKNKIFRAFSQVDGSSRRVYGGSGLGLAISKKLAELMGGTLSFESTEGVGTTFWFNLVATALKPPETDVRLYQGKKCLIADLHQTAKESLITEIQRLGFEVDHCSSAYEAAETVKKSDTNHYSLVFIDFKLLQSEDCTEARIIKAHSPLTQLVYMTIFGVPIPDDTKEKGISAILMRPVQRSRMTHIIRKILNLSWNLDTQLKYATHAQDRGMLRSLSQRHPLKILLAEDNPINTRVALQHLKRLGYGADHAKDGVEVLEMMERELKESRPMYDVILMDIQMPNKDGIATAQEIHATYDVSKQPSIIALTANAAGDDRQKCLSCGMVNYIAKPILPADLAAVLMGIKPLGRGEK